MLTIWPVCLNALMQVSKLSSAGSSSEAPNIDTGTCAAPALSTLQAGSNVLDSVLYSVSQGTCTTELQDLGSSALVALQAGSNAGNLDVVVKTLLNLLVIGLPRAIGSADILALLFRWKLQSSCWDLMW